MLANLRQVEKDLTEWNWWLDMLLFSTCYSYGMFYLVIHKHFNGFIPFNQLSNLIIFRPFSSSASFLWFSLILPLQMSVQNVSYNQRQLSMLFCERWKLNHIAACRQELINKENHLNTILITFNRSKFFLNGSNSDWCIVMYHWFLTPLHTPSYINILVKTKYSHQKNLKSAWIYQNLKSTVSLRPFGAIPI